MVQEDLDFSLYDDELFEVPIIDRDGSRRVIQTKAFARGAIARRRPPILESWLRQRGVLRKTRIGASTLAIVDLREVLDAFREMTRRGISFYDLSPAAGVLD